jgi:hypothetical protein
VRLLKIANLVAIAATTILAAAMPSTGAAASASAVGYLHACPATPPAGQATCLALVRTNVAARRGISPDVMPLGYGPSSLRSAYRLAQAAASSGKGQTVAIVDAGGDPAIASDLAMYRQQYGLPPCGSGCFTQVNQAGGSSLPGVISGWPVEMSLDVDMVSAICPRCRILLVEADSARLTDLGAAVDEAVARGARYVSNSYAAPEFNGQAADDAHYHHPGVAITAAAGDAGYQVNYPASSRFVTAVGGTTLQHAPGSRGWAETAWGNGSTGTDGDGTGSGCSAREAKPAWQSDSGCANRTTADVAAVADPNTGVAIYSSGDGGWLEAGGTSAGAPIIAAVYALAGRPASRSNPAEFPYLHKVSLFDVTSGSNGPCGTYLCNAGPGYDGPTGLGTPDGIAAFRSGNTVTVTAPAAQLSRKGKKITPLRISAADSQAGRTLSFTAAGLPRGLSISRAGVISGTPTVLADSRVSVTVTDRTGAKGSASFSWRVAAQGAITSGLSAGRCISDRSGRIEIARCDGSGSQRWLVVPEANGTLAIALATATSTCVSVKGGQTASGTPVIAVRCVIAASQEWTAGRHGHLTGKRSGKCLADPAAGPNGTQLQIAGCKTTAWQSWHLP